MYRPLLPTLVLCHEGGVGVGRRTGVRSRRKDPSVVVDSLCFLHVTETDGGSSGRTGTEISPICRSLHCKKGNGLLITTPEDGFCRRYKVPLL